MTKKNIFFINYSVMQRNIYTYNHKKPDEERIPYDSFDTDWEIAFK